MYGRRIQIYGANMSAYNVALLDARGSGSNATRSMLRNTYDIIRTEIQIYMNEYIIHIQ